jgi:hypothetical protein
MAWSATLILPDPAAQTLVGDSARHPAPAVHERAAALLTFADGRRPLWVVRSRTYNLAASSAFAALPATARHCVSALSGAADGSPAF